jgi:hypothetical protein
MCNQMYIKLDLFQNLLMQPTKVHCVLGATTDLPTANTAQPTFTKWAHKRMP